MPSFHEMYLVIEKYLSQIPSIYPAASKGSYCWSAANMKDKENDLYSFYIIVVAPTSKFTTHMRQCTAIADNDF